MMSEEDSIILLQESRLLVCQSCQYFELYEDITICANAKKSISLLTTHEHESCPTGEW